MESLLTKDVMRFILKKNTEEESKNEKESYDKEHMCILNRGFCIKQASSQAYATDSTMSGMIQQLCRKENIPFQKYMNHADIRGGGTLGSIISCVLGVKTADIGVPILSMHSSLETMGMEDENSLIHFLRIYYDAM